METIMANIEGIVFLLSFILFVVAYIIFRVGVERIIYKMAEKKKVNANEALPKLIKAKKWLITAMVINLMISVINIPVAVQNKIFLIFVFGAGIIFIKMLISWLPEINKKIAEAKQYK